jgi:hypothetical protein
MLTKKDFKELAEIIRLSRYAENQADALIKGIINFCKQSNPNFNEQKFIIATQ